MHLVVVDNYDSFTYNLVQLLKGAGVRVTVHRNDAIEPETLVNLNPDAVVISPGPGRPEGAGRSLDIALEAPRSGIPLLGVCLGHQCLAQANGARIVRAGELVHGKTGEIFHRGHPLFEGFPSPFSAARYHSLVVESTRFPETLEVIAWNERDEIMALAHRDRPAFGIQFHPESFLSPDGVRLIENFLQMAQRSVVSR